MSKKKSYIMYEGTFLTEAPFYDQSINVLRFRDPEANEYTILINRSFKNEGQTLEEFCETQTNFMANSLPGYKSEGKMLKNEIGPAKLPVIQTANSFLENGQPVKQVQSTVELPWHPVINPARLNLIVFTLASSAEFNDFQRKHYVQIINSFNPETVSIVDS
ncbi:hypothetical protein J3D56_002184 [Erwinia persicina]|jgi:hypothetical protein|uniref:DcrB-related protein n=2 Tax=Erwinia TaxID=551 RepID=A0ABV4E705_9GAMM|nr:MULTISPECIES: DcrB-related protein [Erwinia]MCP1438748.1 hypothetical protein [Erwinia persicina]MDN4628737.1 DcrB-related protein [Erwinia sp. PsM31]MDN8542892.1 DcrB-related protein [Erwinia sp. BC051422]